MDKSDLKTILEKHKNWLLGNPDGVCANLRGANLRGESLSFENLRGADLSGANLSFAKLSSADLSFANLSGADLSFAKLSCASLRGADLSFASLSGADLSFAKLSGADLSFAKLSGANPRGTILENINWLSYIGIVPDMDGFAYAYKMSKRDGKSCTYPVAEINYCNQNEFSAPLDTNVLLHCSTGINLATFQWCLSNKGDDDCRLFLMFFKVSPENVCTPVGTDGKFRVAHCTKIGECDWNGNLLKDGGK